MRQPAARRDVEHFQRVLATADHDRGQASDHEMQAQAEHHRSPSVQPTQADDLNRSTRLELEAVDARVEFAGLLHPPESTQPQLSPASASPATTSQAMAPVLAELLQKHVRRLLVSEATGAKQAVMLRLNDQTLAEVDLVLLRDQDRWRLEARGDAADVLERIDECSQELSDTFDALDLGELEVATIQTNRLSSE